MKDEKIKKLPQKGIHKILIRGTNWIGDAILTLPAVASIRATYPQARIAMLVKPWVADVYDIFSNLDEVIVYENKYDTATGVFGLARMLREKQFDAAILLQNAIEAAIIALFARIPVRAGYNSDARGLLLTHSVPLTRDIKKVHQVNYYLEMVKALGCVSANRDMNLETKISREEAQNVLRRYVAPSQKMLIGIAPGATYGAAKKWFPDRFAETLNRLDEQFSVQGIILGGKADRITAEEVRTSARADMINLAGETSLREAIYLISQCRLFISNDSGLMHVAGALNVPTIAIFGSTNPTTTSPVGKQSLIVRKEVSCSPCLKKTCPTDFRCMTAITVEDVVAAALNLLNGPADPLRNDQKN